MLIIVSGMVIGIPRIQSSTLLSPTSVKPLLLSYSDLARKNASRMSDRVLWEIELAKAVILNSAASALATCRLLKMVTPHAVSKAGSKQKGMVMDK